MIYSVVNIFVTFVKMTNFSHSEYEVDYKGHTNARSQYIEQILSFKKVLGSGLRRTETLGSTIDNEDAAY
jgi:hypothetical protein